MRAHRSSLVRCTLSLIAAPVAMLIAQGCHFDPTFPEGKIVCSSDDSCPSGFVCKQARCYRPETPVDAKQTDTGADLGDAAAGDADGPTVWDAPDGAGADVADVARDVSESDAIDGSQSDAVDAAPPVDAGCVTQDGVPCGSVIGVAAGIRHTCAVTAGGNVLCWGSNALGQLGNGGTADSYVPVRVCTVPGTTAGSCVTPLTGATAIAAGDSHSCALTTAGVKCWGDGTYSQLGSLSKGSAVPVTVSGFSTSDLRAIAAGMHHTCVLTGGGTVECWGYGVDGQLGNNTSTNSNVPVTACATAGANVGTCGATLAGVVAVAAGGCETCVIRTNGNVRCWGAGIRGQLGNNSTTSSPVPVGVCVTAGSGPGTCGTVLSGVKSLGVGRFHACAVVNGGGMKCWGSNASGQLGNNGTADSTIAVDVCASPGATSGTCGTLVTDATFMGPGAADHSCGLAEGRVKCWGHGGGGQLGNGGAAISRVAVNAIGLEGATAVTAAYYHSCAVTSGGGVKCFGANTAGEVGVVPAGDVRVPVDVPLP